MTSNIAAAARDQFNSQAANYNERWASWSDETLRRLLEMTDPQPHWNVLDIATGTGFTALALAPHVASVIGVDISPKMLGEAEKRAAAANVANVSWTEAPAEALPFADGGFDLVTVRIAPHHFANVPAFLRETQRVLAPGGVFVLADTSVPDEDPEAADWQNAIERERDGSHVANLPPKAWREMCEAAGLSLSELDYLPGAIPIPLSAWLDTAGCTGERAARVRELFADAPASARRHFHITDEAGETHFAWARVALRAERKKS